MLKSKTKWATVFSIIKTAVISFLVISAIVIVLVILLPFFLCGPADPFWNLLQNRNATADTAIGEMYLNILQWIAFWRL